MKTNAVKNGMSATPPRPRAYETGVYPWNYRRIPKTIQTPDGEVEHPGRSCAVFVVHGMGDPQWAATAAGLRSGFEDAFEAMADWQRKHLEAPRVNAPQLRPVPPPYIRDGYWANYTDLKATFPKDWARFNERQRDFFSCLWQSRTVSTSRTYGWFLKQQLQLLNPLVIFGVGPLAWFLYLPLSVITFVTLTAARIKYRTILDAFLSDVRLYLDPQGVVEKAIVQRIDYRVGRSFMRMIGLDWEFRELTEDELVNSSGIPVKFERVVWVSHSLGSVISYNVLSDLFCRAAYLAKHGDPKQQQGVQIFRAALRRFVTMGSPLDKVAYLFGKRALRPWPVETRRQLLDGGETLESEKPPEGREWWVNFYHSFDPVSGALSDRLICGENPPTNVHMGLWHLPGFAHTAYWRDLKTLRYILTRTYGTEFLRDREYKHWPGWLLAALATLTHVMWGVILIGIIWLLYKAIVWQWTQRFGG